MQEFSVMAYTFLLTLIEYKTLVMRADFEAANEILPQIPQAGPHSAIAAASSDGVCQKLCCISEEPTVTGLQSLTSGMRPRYMQAFRLE